MRLAEIGHLTDRLHVQDEVDVALAVMPDILRPVVAEMREAHRHEQVRQRFRIGSGELDEFETVETDRVIGSHAYFLCKTGESLPHKMGLCGFSVK